MNPQITIDTRQWVKAARDLSETSKRSAADFINGQALAVASRAFKMTAEADRSKMEHAFGQIGYEEKIISKGKRAGQKVRGKRIIRDAIESTLAARILTQRFARTGSWGVKGTTLGDKVRAFIGLRIASINYIRSGWIPAIAKLSSVVKKKPSGASPSKRVRFRTANGTARPAKPRIGLIFAEIQNSIMGDPKQTTATSVATKGLQEALNFQAADMVSKLAERLKKDLAKYGAR